MLQKQEGLAGSTQGRPVVAGTFLIGKQKPDNQDFVVYEAST